jgi:UDP-N-acetylmuramoyl-tripeptide--D-alanyl-D-alanine ligase
MKIWTVDEIALATHGKTEKTGGIVASSSSELNGVSGVSTDTRGDQTGKVFFALKGDHFDAHEFAGMAAEKGARVLVVSRKIPKVHDQTAVILVDDTLKALQDFATWHRKRWSGKLVALTGSNGKTTTKEYCRVLLAQKFPTLATKGTLNNHIGVPLTVLELRAEHKFAVIEMGMNHAGELSVLTAIAAPDVVHVTNVGRAHIEHFGTLEKIANAKEEIYEAASAHATRIYNLDNSYTATMRARAPGDCKVLSYSSYARDVDVSFKEKVLTLDYIEIQGVIAKDPGHVKIPSFGRQQVSNAMAASCVALACGLDAPLIWKGLALCKSSWGRNQVVDLEGGAKVLFDAYNANPDSAAVAFENFAKLSCRGKKYVVFGDMLELGSLSQSAHQEVGQTLADMGLEGVLIIGQRSRDVESGLRSKGFKKNIVVSEAYEEKLAHTFGAMLETGDMVLVKGSRGMHLERVVECFRPQNFDKKL